MSQGHCADGVVGDSDKQRWRREVRNRRRARRDALTPGERAEIAGQYASTLLRHLAHRAPGTITAYESWATEPPTEQLIDALRDAGWTVLVPETLDDMRLSWHEAGAAVDLGVDAVSAADVLLIPALSVDRDGRRLGQGGGCYDRTLPLARPGAPVIGMVWPDELVDEIPAEPHDRRVDAVLLPDAVVPLDAGPVAGRVI